MKKQDYYTGLLNLYMRLSRDPKTHRHTLKGVEKLIKKEYEKLKD